MEPVDFDAFLNLDSAVLKTTRLYAPDLQLYALPLGEVKTALFYNKNIFNEMNVRYPSDGMTWDKVKDLAYQLTNPERWASLIIDNMGIVASQLHINEYEFTPDELDLSSEPWIKMESFIESLKGTGSSVIERPKAFGRGEAAMYVGPIFSAGLLDPHDKPTIDNWDVVSHPIFDDGQYYEPATEIVYVGIPRRSVQKEIAMEIINFLFSKEMQTEYMRLGLSSFGMDIDEE